MRTLLQSWTLATAFNMNYNDVQLDNSVISWHTTFQESVTGEAFLPNVIQWSTIHTNIIPNKRNSKDHLNYLVGYILYLISLNKKIRIFKLRFHRCETTAIRIRFEIYINTPRSSNKTLSSPDNLYLHCDFLTMLYMANMY